jgi:capsular polysaccharide biosynthesis protein
MTSEIYTPQALVDLMLTASRELDFAQEDLVTKTRAAADSERKYRMMKSEKYLQTEGTVNEREAVVAQQIDTYAYAAHLAEGLERAALENVRNRRAQLSALQSIANAVRAEAELTRSYG